MYLCRVEVTALEALPPKETISDPEIESSLITNDEPELRAGNKLSLVTTVTTTTVVLSTVTKPVTVQLTVSVGASSSALLCIPPGFAVCS